MRSSSIFRNITLKKSFCFCIPKTDNQFTYDKFNKRTTAQCKRSHAHSTKTTTTTKMLLIMRFCKFQQHSSYLANGVFVVPILFFIYYFPFYLSIIHLSRYSSRNHFFVGWCCCCFLFDSLFPCHSLQFTAFFLHFIQCFLSIHFKLFRFNSYNYVTNDLGLYTPQKYICIYRLKWNNTEAMWKNVRWVSSWLPFWWLNIRHLGARQLQQQ